MKENNKCQNFNMIFSRLVKISETFLLLFFTSLKKLMIWIILAIIKSKLRAKNRIEKIIGNNF